MLIKGANRDIKDDIGRRPVDMIDPCVSQSTRKELESILGKQPISLPCSQIKTPLIKLRKNFRTFAIYVMLMLGTIA
jgi:hypothetical protein